jgi:hypothetical protein
MEAVPVLLITGPVGVGKSTVLFDAARLLRQASVPHAVVDLAQIGAAWPAPPDDRWQERLIHRNLACVWSNFRDAGAETLLLARVLEDRSLLRHIEAAVPGARITVVRLRASKEVLEARIRRREGGRDPSWYLDVAAYLVDVMEQSEVAEHVVTNEQRSVAEVATEVLRAAGWLS